MKPWRLYKAMYPSKFRCVGLAFIMLVLPQLALHSKLQIAQHALLDHTSDSYIASQCLMTERFKQVVDRADMHQFICSAPVSHMQTSCSCQPTATFCCQSSLPHLTLHHSFTDWRLTCYVTLDIWFQASYQAGLGVLSKGQTYNKTCINLLCCLGPLVLARWHVKQSAQPQRHRSLD